METQENQMSFTSKFISFWLKLLGGIDYNGHRLGLHHFICMVSSSLIMGIPGLSFSWKRALGITGLKLKFAHKTGIPTTKHGMQHKIGGWIWKAIFGK